MSIIRCAQIMMQSLCFTLLMLVANQANAACSASATTTPSMINIGNHPSQNIPSGGLSSNANSASANFRVSCTYSLSLQLLSTTSWLRITAQQALTLSNGSDIITYTIAGNSTYNPAITTVGQHIGGPTGFNLLTLAILSGGQINVPIFIKTLPTSIWPSAGVYTGTQSLFVEGVICTGIGVLGLCLGTNPVSSTVSISLQLTVSKSCEFINTPALVDFGSVSFLEQATTIQLNANLRCTNLEDYLLYADNGNNYASNSRHMRSAIGNTIAYSLRQPASPTSPLDSTNPLARVGTGASESLSIPLVITPGQSTPPAGVYTDNVRLVIEY